MTVFGYTESHQERWTISDSEASMRSPREPERCAFGHLAWLSGEILGAENRRIFSSQEIPATDVLVIAQPQRLSNGASSADADEVAAILKFVEAGAGIFIIAGHCPAGRLSVGTRLAALLGIHVTENRLFSAPAENDCLLSDSIACSSIMKHQATRGVRQIICHRGVALKCAEESLSVISTPSGETVFAISSYGSGRVAVIGSSELFALPHVGEADNAVLYLSTLAWLAGTEADRIDPAPADLVHRLVIENEYSPRTPAWAGPMPTGSVPTLSAGEVKRELLRLYRTDLDPYMQAEEFLARASLAYHDLPEFVRRKVMEFRNESNDFGALLVTGLPADPVLPPTPDEPSARPHRSTYMSEFWLAVSASSLGDQVGYAQESSGALFQNVVPTKANAASLSSQSSQVLLDLHTEVAFHPVMPDYILLYCLRPARDGDAMTLVSGTRSMLQLLPPGHRASLFRRAFRTGIDHSYGSANGHAGNGPLVCVLHGDPFDPLMRLDPDLMLGDDAEARAALAEICNASKACQAPVALARSDLLIIDNRRAVHGRSPFNAYYDGQDRWLQRSFVLRDLCRFSAHRPDGDRVIGTVFAV